MKIPKSLKIGGHSYKIELVKEGELAKNDCGSLSRENNKIYIDTKLSDSNRTVTLIHEILHAVNNELSESFVDGLAEQLYQVLKDNKLLNKKYDRIQTRI